MRRASPSGCRNTWALLTLPPSGPPCRLRLGCAASLIEDGLAFDYQLLDAERTPAGRVTVAILDAMHRAVSSRGMRLVLMTIPRRIQPRPSRTEELLVRWAARTRTPLVNLRKAYLELPEAERAPLYASHWTPYGAALTARACRAGADGEMTSGAGRSSAARPRSAERARPPRR